MTVPPRDPWHRRTWAYGNRPYTGCGCLYLLLVFVLIMALVSWILTPGWTFGWP